MGGDVQSSPLFGPDLRHGRVGEDAPVQKLHDVKRRADHAAVLAQTVRLGHRHIRLLQRVDDLVLALDLVRRLGQ